MDRYFTFRVPALLAFTCLASPLLAQTSAPLTSVVPKGAPEQRAARALEAARSSPPDLEAFLWRMPKGADLHYHLTGGIYAESWLRGAAEDGLCVDLATHTLVKPQGMTESAPPLPVCETGRVSAAQALSDQNLYDALVNAFSMRSFVPFAGVSGHDHFFDAFAKFDAATHSRASEWLDEIASRAAAQNEQYLELMETPDFSHIAEVARRVGWNNDLAQLREELLSRGLREDMAGARAERNEAETAFHTRAHCDTPHETPACKVTIRYLYQILRGFPKEQVFAQTLVGFEVASVDPRFVGVNYVMPEDGTTSMADYALHMKIVRFLHGLYPKVRISLHAGELAPGLVPPEGLCCHIRLAIEEGHAERIGHGVDVMHENRPYDLLKEMAAKHVMVETNLTSNDLILGVAGKDHPLPIYRKYHVPVALSTDDEGVSRINLTHEYVRAAETYGLSYSDLKNMARTGLEHSFLPGANLWVEQDNFARPAAVCGQVTLGAANPPAACADFLRSSEKARQQWELERRFREFESEFK